MYNSQNIYAAQNQYDPWRGYMHGGAPYNAYHQIGELRYKANQLHAESQKLMDEADRIEASLRMKAPTIGELNNSEALSNAYNEMMLVWKLVGEKK